MQIFELFGSILLKDPGVEGQLDKIDKKASSTSKGMGISFGSIASAALKAAAVIGTGLGIKDMIETAAKGQDRLVQTEAVLKSTGEAAGMTSDAITKLTNAQNGLSLNSKGANRETENLMLTFTKIGKDIFPQALTTVNDMSQALGQDTKSSAIQLGKALQDPIKGVTALARVGVNFTAQQKEQIKTLVASGKTMEAQKIILAELGTEFGGSALAASKNFDGQMIILKNNMHSMGGTIGNAVLPYLTQFSTWINSHMPQIQQFVTDAMKAIGDALTNVADFVKTNLMPIFKELFDWISPYMPQIRQFVVDAFTKIKEMLKVVGDFVKENIIPAFKLLKEKFDEYFPKIKDAVMKAYEYLKPHFDKLVATIKSDLMPIIMMLWDTFKKAWPGIQSIFEIVFPIIVVIIGRLIDGIGIFIGIVKGVYGFIKPPLDLVFNIFSTVFGGIQKLIEGVQWVLDKFNGTPMNNKSATVTTNQQQLNEQAAYRKNDGGGDGRNDPKYHNAAGTDFWQGGDTWVGEKGPEIVRLPRGSQIIPNDKSMAMMNGKSSKPAIIQLVLQNGKILGEYLLPDLDILMGNKTRVVGRSAGV